MTPKQVGKIADQASHLLHSVHTKLIGGEKLGDMEIMWLSKAHGMVEAIAISFRDDTEHEHNNEVGTSDPQAHH